ncbi:MAG: nitroreductase family protein [Clostridia bacterium]
MTNEVIQNIITRRSIKQYKDQQITDEELQTVLDAGLYAPSGMGMQSPVMVVVQDKDTMAQIVRMNAAVMNATSNPYYDAPTVILVLAPTDRTTYIEDASCVLDTMMLAAHSIGLASRWIHRERQMFETEEGKELMKKWGIPENFAGVGALALGYADCELPEPKEERREGRIIYADK